MTPHNEPNPHPREAYSPAALAACEKALRTILTKIGPWGSQLVLIGGMTPRYLVGRPPPDIRAHAGTTDLDIVVGVTLATEEAEAYRTLLTEPPRMHVLPLSDTRTRDRSRRSDGSATSTA